MSKIFSALTCLVFVGAQLDARVPPNRGGGRVEVQNRSAASFNRSAEVNRNTNVNVNRNVDVHGGTYRGCCYHDGNWGAYTAGAVTGAAIGAAVAHPTTVVVAPAVGSLVGVLPGSCAAVNVGGTVLYNCGNVYYRPFYQGASLVYQVVTYP